MDLYEYRNMDVDGGIAWSWQAVMEGVFLWEGQATNAYELFMNVMMISKSMIGLPSCGVPWCCSWLGAMSVLGMLLARRNFDDLHQDKESIASSLHQVSAAYVT